ncbi:COR2B protein, partial [Columbina picui]|nr:COR2B protein [Columbina picui]
MSWRPQYRSSKFRNVYGKVASREHCFDGIPITKNVHDNHFCAVNARFLAIVTESAGGGSFLVIPLEQVGGLAPAEAMPMLMQSWSPSAGVRMQWDVSWSLLYFTGFFPCGEGRIYSCLSELSGFSAKVTPDIRGDGHFCFAESWSLPPARSRLSPGEVPGAAGGGSAALGLGPWGDAGEHVWVWQEASCKNHRVNRVVFLGSTKRLLTTGVSRWNTRQIALWDQEDLSMPLIEEEIDGLSGLLFPFYDADTHMLYLAGKGDGNIRYYEIGSEKPYLSYLMEFRSPAPQKGLGKGGCAAEQNPKSLIHDSSETYQEDIYPMTPGTEPALTPDEWLSGVNRDPILMSLKEGYKKTSKIVFKAPAREKKSVVVNGIDLLENVPPRTENELLRMFFRQQDEIRRLKDELSQKDIRIRQLHLELKNLRNSPKNN